MSSSPKKKGPVSRTLRVLITGGAAGVLTFMVAAALTPEVVHTVLKLLARPVPGPGSVLLAALVLAASVSALGAAVAYGAGLLIETRPWLFAAAQMAGFLVFPVPVQLISRDASEDSLGRAALALAAIAASTWLWAVAFRRGQARMRAPPEPKEAPGAGTGGPLSKIDFEAIRRAEEKSASASPEAPAQTEGDAPKGS